MRLGDVDLPLRLVERHKAGELVIFVGAGASVPPPSRLPNFKDLTDLVAADLGADITKLREEKVPDDAILGRLADQGHAVHHRVHHHIARPRPRRNLTHDAIARLAVSSGKVRIVTTNYDRHLTNALPHKGRGIDEYVGPALPTGRNFGGLVYLHGTITRPADELIVTDRDFGRAYLRDAWATRFLEPMFQTFAVLFVGYSHTDTVMRYLGLALGPDTERYVLTHNASAPHWRELGIEPIAFPLARGRDAYRALRETLDLWSTRASMGMRDHDLEVKQFLASPPSQVPQVDSYLASVIDDPGTVQLFTKYAATEEWLAWAFAISMPSWEVEGSVHPFKCLFTRTSADTESSPELAQWFSERFATNVQTANTALELVRRGGGQLQPIMWRSLAFALMAQGVSRAASLSPWIALLVENDPRDHSDSLDYLLDVSDWSTHRCDMLVLLDHLTMPHARLTPSFGAGPPRVELSIRGSVHWIERALKKLRSNHMRDAAADLLVIADHHLRIAGSSDFSGV